MKLFDLKSFTLHPDLVLEYAAAGGGVLTLVGTCLNVLAALVYNLLSDVVGGIQVIVVGQSE